MITNGEIYSSYFAYGVIVYEDTLLNEEIISEYMRKAMQAYDDYLKVPYKEGEEYKSVVHFFKEFVESDWKSVRVYIPNGEDVELT